MMNLPTVKSVFLYTDNLYKTGDQSSSKLLNFIMLKDLLHTCKTVSCDESKHRKHNSSLKKKTTHTEPILKPGITS